MHAVRYHADTNADSHADSHADPRQTESARTISDLKASAAAARAKTDELSAENHRLKLLSVGPAHDPYPLCCVAVNCIANGVVRCRHDNIIRC